MKLISSNLNCPACSHPLKPRLLVCDKCDIRVEGQFQLNEFALLAPEDLHFLRIFVRCEGRIRDMESALGLSYPTIRVRLTELKNKLVGDRQDGSSKPELATTEQILERLRLGEISFDEAMKQIKEARSKTTQ